MNGREWLLEHPQVRDLWLEFCHLWKRIALHKQYPEWFE